MKTSTSGSVKFVLMSLDRPTRSFRLLQTDRTSEDRLRNKRRSSHAMSCINELKMSVVSFWRKLIKIAFWIDSFHWFNVP